MLRLNVAIDAEAGDPHTGMTLAEMNAFVSQCREAGVPMSAVPTLSTIDRAPEGHSYTEHVATGMAISVQSGRDQT